MTQASIPISIDEAINAKILAVSEDQIAGFQVDPFEQISQRSGVPLPVVLDRIGAMLASGTIRRVRQTLMANKLAPGALVAWQVPNEKLQTAFDWMFKEDPFSGHVVIRTTDTGTAGSRYRLWTTIKVPQGFSMSKHCDFLCQQTGAQTYRLMPAKKLFVLGVGHVRRRHLDPGARFDEPGRVIDTQIVAITDLEWQVLRSLKREFTSDEIVPNPWLARAREVQLDLDTFIRISQSLADRGVIGRFSTFLEHVKKLKDGMTVTKYNALFHWAVPAGREIESGREVGRHYCMTHAYWREGGPEFHNVNVMGVVHGTERQRVLDHKIAIDEHLAAGRIPVSYTNVFWGGRSEIKPSEISPIVYQQWCERMGLNLDSMRD